MCCSGPTCSYTKRADVVVFTYSSTWFSKLIRLVTKSNVSHCAIVNNKYVIEANPFEGVREIALDDFKEVQHTVYAFKVGDVNCNCANTLKSRYGKYRYGFGDLFYTVLKNVFKLKWHDLLDRNLICSEVVALYLEECYGVEILKHYPAITPVELLEWCKSNLEEIKQGDEE